MESSYIPKHYKVENEEFLFEFVQKNSFATVFTTNSTSIPEITHIPIFVEKNEVKTNQN
jgi:transcriptional regulator